MQLQKLPDALEQSVEEIKESFAVVLCAPPYKTRCFAVYAISEYDRLHFWEDLVSLDKLKVCCTEANWKILDFNLQLKNGRSCFKEITEAW